MNINSFVFTTECRVRIGSIIHIIQKADKTALNHIKVRKPVSQDIRNVNCNLRSEMNTGNHVCGLATSHSGATNKRKTLFHF